MNVKMKNEFEEKVKLGDTCARNYQFEEAINYYLLAEKTGEATKLLYLKLGGAQLTLNQFQESFESYQKAIEAGMTEEEIAQYMGTWYYLTHDYRSAFEWFSKMNCHSDEMEIIRIFWTCMADMKLGGTLCREIEVKANMEVGHHTAYYDAVRVFTNMESYKRMVSQYENEKSDLNYVIAMYGLYVYGEYANYLGKVGIASILEKKSVWPCIAYLAARQEKPC